MSQEHPSIRITKLLNELYDKADEVWGEATKLGIPFPKSDTMSPGAALINKDLLRAISKAADEIWESDYRKRYGLEPRKPRPVGE